MSVADVVPRLLVVLCAIPNRIDVASHVAINRDHAGAQIFVVVSISHASAVDERVNERSDGNATSFDSRCLRGRWSLHQSHGGPLIPR